MVARKYISTELGREAQCARCKEFWPADGEFFFTSKGKLHSWCKACYRSDPKVIQKVQRWQDKQRAAKAVDNLATATLEE